MARATSGCGAATRLARFTSLAHPREGLVQPLTDAQLLYAAADILIGNGSETIDNRDYLQPWGLAPKCEASHPLAPLGCAPRRQHR